MLFILSLCLKIQVELCSVLLTGQEEGDLVQKPEKNRPLKRSGKGKCWKDRAVNNYLQKYFHWFLNRMFGTKDGTTSEVLNKQHTLSKYRRDGQIKN